MTRSESGLIVETHGHVRVLTLDRPERRNALSSALQADLVEELLTCADGRRRRARSCSPATDPRSAPASTSRRSARPTSAGSASGRR